MCALHGNQRRNTSVHLSQNKPQNSLPVIKGKDKWRKQHAGFVWFSHNIYKALLWKILQSCWLLHKKMTSLLVFGVNKDQVSARHEIWNSAAWGRLDITQLLNSDFFISSSLAATSTCTCLALLFTPPSAEAFYQEGWELERFPSPGLWAEDFPPPIAQHRLPIKWTSTQGGDRGRPRRINKTI